MSRKKRIKRIFLYDEDTPTAVHYYGAYKHIKAISDDEKHYFEFTVNQDNYGQSLKELCERFETFCVEECGFDDSRYCEIWSTFEAHRKILSIENYNGEFYDDTLDGLLGSCRWACARTMETSYSFLCSHLVSANSELSPPTFAEFTTANGYNEKDEPFATLKLFPRFEAQVNKRQFTQQELSNVLNYIKSNIHSVEKRNSLSNVRMALFLEPAILRLYKFDKKTLREYANTLSPKEREYIKAVLKGQKNYE